MLNLQSGGGCEPGGLFADRQRHRHRQTLHGPQEDAGTGPGEGQGTFTTILILPYDCPTFTILSVSVIFQTGRICTIIGLIWVVSIVAILPAMFYTGTYDIYFPYSDLPLYHLWDGIQRRVDAINL